MLVLARPRQDGRLKPHAPGGHSSTGFRNNTLLGWAVQFHKTGFGQGEAPPNPSAAGGSRREVAGHAKAAGPIYRSRLENVRVQGLALLLLSKNGSRLPKTYVR